MERQYAAREEKKRVKNALETKTYQRNDKITIPYQTRLNTSINQNKKFSQRNRPSNVTKNRGPALEEI